MVGMNSTNKRSARVELDGVPLAFQTQVWEAFEFLRNLPTFFNDVAYSFAEISEDQASTLPTCEYENGEPLCLSYDANHDCLRFRAPWDIVPNSNMLRMCLWMLRALVAQRTGRIRLHASAVSCGDLATLLIGESESGKTTAMLELCLAHGHSLCANDSVEIELRQGLALVVGGDSTITFRLSSLRDYSAELARSVFGADYDRPDAWSIKRQKRVADCGIRLQSLPIPIARLIFVKLDRNTNPYFRNLNHRDEPRLTRWAKARLFEETCLLLRGAVFTPFDPAGNYVSLPVPSLDTPELVSARVSLLNALFDQSEVWYYRGALEPLIAGIVGPRSAIALVAGA